MSQVKILFSFVRLVLTKLIMNGWIWSNLSCILVRILARTITITITITINNADLYAANQGSTELINETYAEEVPLRFMGQDVLYHQPLSLD